jgi:peptidoglycan/LPS O-acetylase OafA/YrhL
VPFGSVGPVPLTVCAQVACDPAGVERCLGGYERSSLSWYGEGDLATRIAGLNGLRAVAVAGVLLYHGGLAAMPAGFLGVDLFFVISGFLITTLLLREATAGAGKIDVVGFWGRRIRRLLPGLALVVVATLLVFTLADSTRASGGLAGDAAAGLLYVANWHFLSAGGGYFDQFALPSPFQHTWSLAIEEQFYIVWPLLLLMALQLRVRRAVLTVATAAAALFSATWMSNLFGRGASVDRVYYGTDTRSQAILVGVVTAFLLERVINQRPGHRRAPSRLRLHATDAAGIAALGLVIAAMALWSAHSDEIYSGGLLLVAIGSGVVIATVVLSPGGLLTRALEMRPLQIGGVLSYSLYLWHWPVFLFLTAGRTSLGGGALLAVRLTVTLALASAAYYLVEAPLRRADWRLGRVAGVPIGVTGLVCGLVLVAAGGTATLTRQPPASATLAINQHSRADTGQHLSVAPPTTLQGQTATARESGPHPLRVTLLGDSTALTLGDGLSDVPGINGVDFFNAAILGCGVTTASPYRYMGEISPYPHTQCGTWEARWRRRVTSRPADVVAILIGRWEVTDQMVNGTWTHVGTPLFDAYLEGQLQQAVDAASAGGACVVFLTAPYYNRGEQPNGSIWPEDDPARVDALNKILHQVAARQPEPLNVIDFGRRVSGGGHQYLNEVDGVVLRYDGVHFTPAAARWIQPWLRQQLGHAARRRAASPSP